MAILKRFPAPQQIIPVYGLIVMLVYGWSLYWFIWNLSSWVTFLDSNEIVSIYLYALAVNLLESIVILLFVTISSVVLPSKWIRDDFVWRGSSVALLFLIYPMILLSGYVPLAELGIYALYGLVIFIAIQSLSLKIAFLRSVVVELAERSAIFLYISVPLSLIALVIVAARNI